jgi:hypothetical protein
MKARRYIGSKHNSVSPENETMRGYTTNATTSRGKLIGVNQSEIAKEWDDSENYSMVTSLFDYEALKHLPTFGLKVYPKAIYRGELQDTKRHGRGCMSYQSGRVHEGYWVNDKRNGPGYE